MLVFSTPLADYRPSNILSGSPPPAPLFLVWISTGVCIYTVCNGGGGGEGTGLCREHIQELYTLYLPRFRTYRSALPPPPKKKNIGGEGGLKQINTCRHVPLQVNFWKKPTFRILESFSYLVHDFYTPPPSPLKHQLLSASSFWKYR
jgi:hypothetical protein